jgi:serine protease Do
VGDWVVAIGSPMGLEHSASVGILSARGRGSLGLYRDSYIDFLQTDADIAPGSSGGPLFNLAGEVVGINTAVGAVAQGPGFAIPIDQAKQIIVQLREKGQVIRGWLGAANEPDAEGAVVGKIFPDTPAARAGLQRGDLIKQVDGHAVASFDELRAMIAGLPPGHTALFTVDRGGKELELTAVLSERPGAHDLDRLAADRSLTPPTAPFPTPVPPAGPRLGVQAKAHDKGLEVVRVEPGSLGDDLDLQAGDIIIRLNGATVHRPEDVAAALERERAKVDIELMRNGVKHRVTLERS